MQRSDYAAKRQQEQTKTKLAIFAKGHVTAEHVLTVTKCAKIGSI